MKKILILFVMILAGCVDSYNLPTNVEARHKFFLGCMDKGRGTVAKDLVYECRMATANL